MSRKRKAASRFEPTYMGDNWEEYAELADAVLIAGPDKQELPVHSSELAKHSKVLLSAIAAHKRQGLGEVKLEAPFAQYSLDCVVLYLSCCYQLLALTELLDAALHNDAGCAVVQEMLQLMHLVQADSLLARCVKHVVSRVPTLGGSLMGWLATAERCRTTSLLLPLRQRAVARLQDRATFDAAAADFASGVKDVEVATVAAILATMTNHLVEVEWDIQGFDTADGMLSSRPFVVGSHQWHLNLYPKGEQSSAPGKVAVYLVPKTAGLPAEWSVKTKYSVTFVSSTEANSISASTEREWSNTNLLPYGWKDMASRDALLDVGKGFLKEGALKVRARVEVLA